MSDLCVPLNGRGALFEVEELVGVSTAATVFPLFELIVPPSALMDCQVPVDPEYEYEVPVE